MFLNQDNIPLCAAGMLYTLSVSGRPPTRDSISFFFPSLQLVPTPNLKNWSLKVDIVYIWLSLLSLLCIYFHIPNLCLKPHPWSFFILFFSSWIVRPVLCAEKNPPLVWRILLLCWWKDMRSFKCSLIPLVKACLSRGIHASKGILCILAIP